MATEIPTVSGAPHNDDGSVKIIEWTALGQNDDGSPVSIPQFADRTVSFSGTFAAATVVLEGSNDGTTWFTLTDPQGNAITKTSAAMETILENPVWIRPNVTGGAAETEIKAIVCARLNNPLRT